MPDNADDREQVPLPEGLIPQHDPALLHHLKQGQAWLKASAGGENSAATSYAALEFRFALERLVVHYWRLLLDRPFDANELQSFKFDSVRRKVASLVGRQHQIARLFEFVRIVTRALKIDAPMPTPDLGKLYDAWGACSEVCHIGFPLSSAAAEARQSAFATLVRVESELLPLMHSGAWPLVRDANFDGLRKRFADGNADENDVLEYLRSVGVWAKVEQSDGTAAFLGQAIPPASHAV